MTALSTYMSEAAAKALPDEVAEKAKQHILDTFAAMISGSELPPGRAALGFAKEYGGKEVATAYFDTHVVRTLAETVMVLVDATGSIARIEVLSFGEPEEYLPRPHWYEQFSGRRLDDELSLKRGVRAVSGATLTARATVEAARRILAIDRVLRRRAP